MWHAADVARDKDLDTAACAVMQATASAQSVRELLAQHAQPFYNVHLNSLAPKRLPVHRGLLIHILPSISVP
jgi:hypothetical protein